MPKSSKHLARATSFALFLIVAIPFGASAQDTSNDTSDQSVAPAPIDPCQLVTSDEASSLAGASFSTGLEQTNDGGGRTCVYGAQTLNVFMVTVGQAVDAGTAQSEWSDQEAKAQNAMQQTVPPGANINLTINDTPDLPTYDRAAVGSAGMTLRGTPLNVSAIFLLKGAAFVTFSDLLVGRPAPTQAALESEAQTVFGRLP